MNMRTALMALTLAGGLAVAGCSKATADNYAKIETGMTHDQVHVILGQPDSVSGSSLGALSMSTETWSGRSQDISVTFAGDKLVLKNIEPRKQ
ncbi:MAG: hypothetical protein ACRETM_04705 [Stenotrophobium sp.]